MPHKWVESKKVKDLFRCHCGIHRYLISKDKKFEIDAPKGAIYVYASNWAVRLPRAGGVAIDGWAHKHRACV